MSACCATSLLYSPPPPLTLVSPLFFVLNRFAASRNPLRVSFAVILARACIRVRKPQRARHIFEQKVTSRQCSHVHIDCVREAFS